MPTELDIRIINTLINDYENGKSINQLSIDNNISIPLVSRTLKDNNVNITHRKKYKSNDFCFSSVKCEKSAYLLGLLYSDGSVNKKNKIILGLNQQDGYLVELLKEFMSYSGPLYFVKKNTDKCSDNIRLEVSNTKICEDLKTLGCVNNKTFLLKFPTQSQVPKLFIRHFIRGYFDGDGCIWTTKNNNTMAEIVGTNDFCCGLFDYLSSIGIESKINHSNRTSVKTLKIFARPSILFFDHIYKDSSIKMMRKFDIFKNFINSYTKRKTSGGSKIKESTIEEIKNNWN